jgi:hypothetical protein
MAVTAVKPGSPVVLPLPAEFIRSETVNTGALGAVRAARKLRTESPVVLRGLLPAYQLQRQIKPPQGAVRLRYGIKPRCE